MAKVYSTECSRYTDQFKQLAVLLSYQPDMLALEVAEKLGIHPIMLYRWRLEVKQKRSRVNPTPLTFSQKRIYSRPINALRF
jgi:transposase